MLEPQEHATPSAMEKDERVSGLSKNGSCESTDISNDEPCGSNENSLLDPGRWCATRERIGFRLGGAKVGRDSENPEGREERLVLRRNTRTAEHRRDIS